jgi:hypothetical protein
MEPCAGANYNLTLYPLQSRLQHIYHGQPYARVHLNPMPEPESTLSHSQGLWIWPQFTQFNWGKWLSYTDKTNRGNFFSFVIHVNTRFSFTKNCTLA